MHRLDQFLTQFAAQLMNIDSHRIAARRAAVPINRAFECRPRDRPPPSFHECVYAGSDEYRAVPTPLINYRSGNFFITPRAGLPAMGLSFELAPELEGGVFVGLGQGRDADDADRTRGLDDIDFHGVYGAFIEWTPGRYSLGAAYRQAAKSGYGGTLELRASYAILQTERQQLRLGVSTQWANSDDMQTWYGVSTSDAARSREHLSPYSASSALGDRPMAHLSFLVLMKTPRAMTTSNNEETQAAKTGTITPYGLQSQSGHLPQRKKVTTVRLSEMRRQGEKITMLTAYDATFAAIEDAAGVDCILVGDSLGMVCQGQSSTVSVSLDEMAYHTRCVAKGLDKTNGAALLVADLPFGSYHASRDQAMASSIQLMEAGAQMVKLEGGGWTTEVVHFLVERGVPVCGHLGLTPQTVSALGGYRVQGKDDGGAAKLMRDAKALDNAGASLLVLEMIPAKLAADLTDQMQTCATIGIGAGAGTAGQVLVMHDMLGINIGRMPKFVRNFMLDAGGVSEAFAAYVKAVKEGSFPDNALHSW